MRFTMRSRFSVSFAGLVSMGISDASVSVFVCVRAASLELRAASKRELASAGDWFPQHPLFDSLLKHFALKNSFHEHARRVHHVRIEFSGLNQMLDFGDRDLGGGSHHGIEVARRLAVDEIAPSVALPGFHESEVSFERALHDVGVAIEFAGFFAFGDYSATPVGV